MKNFLRIPRATFSSLRSGAVGSDSGARSQLPVFVDTTMVPGTETSLNSVINKVQYGLPLDEDLKAGAIAGSIRNHWSNVPGHTRKVLEEASNSGSSSSTWLFTEEPVSAIQRTTNTMLSLIGKGPAELQTHRESYFRDLELVPHRKGQKAAYHWSRMLIPRTVAARCRGDLRVDPLTADRSILLLDRLMGQTSIVYCFSGHDLSGLNTGIKSWKKRLEGTIPESVQTLNIHFCAGWLSRRTHPLTRQILRSFTAEPTEETGSETTLIYRGKWHRDLVLDFHLYNTSLPSVLLIDKKGYVRWHAVGLPTDECVEAISPLLHRLSKEKN
jgi:hypothetical protein